MAGDYRLAFLFYIETDAYTDRDRAMFVAGAEFMDIAHHVRYKHTALHRPISKENTSRVRMLCGQFGRECSIESFTEADDPEGLWSLLHIEPKRKD